MIKLFEIKYFEPEQGDQSKATLSGRNNHPARYRRVNCWGEMRNGTMHYCLVGSQGWFAFPDNFCPIFLGEFPAIQVTPLRSVKGGRYAQIGTCSDRAQSSVSEAEGGLSRG
jgi:hypothetical protein